MVKLKDRVKIADDECENIHRMQGVSVGMIPSNRHPARSRSAEIVFDHVVVDGKCMLQIAEINGVLGYHDLPDEYKMTRPMMYRLDRWLWICTDGIGYRYEICQPLLESEAEKLVERMRACGKRLHDINMAARAKADEERLERWKAKGRTVVRI